MAFKYDLRPLAVRLLPTLPKPPEAPGYTFLQKGDTCNGIVEVRPGIFAVEFIRHRKPEAKTKK